MPPRVYWSRTAIRSMSSTVGSRIECSSLSFSLRTASAERGRRLHQRQCQYLQHVVLQDVAGGAGALVEAAARPDAEGLCGGDLYMVDPGPVPDRLEDRVGEPERK